MKYMDDYTRMGLTVFKRNVEDLNNLNELGLYLAKEIKPEAINTLKLMVLANGAGRLDKPLDINKIKKYKEVKWYGEVDRRENIVGNLSFNPQNVANELMETLIQNYNVNMNVIPYGTGYTYFTYWIRSLSFIENYHDKFYKRYDMVDKKLDIITYMVDNGLLLPKQINYIKRYVKQILESDSNYYAFSKEQLLRMQIILEYKLPKYKRKKFEEKENKRDIFYDKLTDFYFSSSDIDYIEEEFPKILKKTKAD